MNLVEQLSALTVRVVRIQEGQGARRQMAALQGRAEMLAQPAAQYAELAARARTLRSRAIAFDAPEDLAALGFRAKQVLAAFQQDPGSVIEPSSDVRYGFWDRLGEVAVATERILHDGWVAHVNATMPRIDSALIDVLPSISENDRRRAADIQNSVRALTMVTPDDVQTVDELDALVVRARELLGSLGVEGLSDDVRAFVTALARNEATLELVTPGVVDWLRAEGLLARVQLRLGA